MRDLIVIAPGSSEDFISLSDSKPSKGKRFKKHILSTGVLHYPGVNSRGKLYIDDAFMETVVTNFKNKVCPIVQVPVVDEKNRHSEDPLRNIGRVVDLSVDEGKLYATIEAYKHGDDIGKTLIGASAMLSTDYVDTRTSEKSGPTLLHVAVTNRPHVTELEDFEEIIAASSDSSGEAVLLTADNEENTSMDLDQLIEQLRSDHDINVPELQERAAVAEDAEQKYVDLSNQVISALDVSNTTVALSNSDSVVETIVGAISEIRTENVELSSKIEELSNAASRKDAEARVDSLIEEGRILPASRDAQVELLLSNAEMFDAILPPSAIINLSGEELGDDPTDPDPAAVAQAEIDRIAAEQNL